ncbi:MAG: Na/Pi cotransporter family protein [Gammaproteobacteria bacterium]|nr:Na/Pi cotransporter family protein [Gammaproteobacteria bacterium]
MLRKVILPTVLTLLAYGFWISEDFKEISAGVAIFLFGMLALEQGFSTFTGGVLERVLRKSTDKMWKSLSFGFTAATVMQSSSLVSVITISFLSAGLIGLIEGMGIIFGANVGTTTGAWLIAGFGLKVKISAYAMPMLVFGVVMVFQRSKTLKGIGYILAGLGFLFLGIHHMKEGFETFQNQINLTDFAMEGFAGVLVFTLVGIAATIIMQSSHATLVLVITALSVQQVTYENALALTIGANVGTTITAVLGSLTSNFNGKRLALADVLFKVAAGVVFMVTLQPMITVIESIALTIGLSHDDYTLKLAIFHTIFNITGVIIMVPLIQQLVKLVSAIIPEKRREQAEPIYLLESALELPDTALEAVRKESLHLFDNAFEIIAHGISLHRHDILSDVDLEEVSNQQSKKIEIDIDAEYEKNIKTLYNEIITFISQAQTVMTPEQNEELFILRAACRDIVEAIKGTKHLHKNMVRYISADNESIRAEYNKIRLFIGEVLREINAMKLVRDDPTSILSLDAIRLEMEENDVTANGMLEELIRKERITADMATSLMNDSAYLYDVTKNLVQMGEALFASGDQGIREAERSLILDDDEMEELQRG